ncbi:hypothetical protein HYV70_05350 [Candidatus Uhrbacteria bacterium]|nr:hypothetical protein [Candidatus Uhrbacteria bacterium]
MIDKTPKKLPNKWIDGELVPATELGVVLTLDAPNLPSNQGYRLTHTTGKAESQWIYPVLSILATCTSTGIREWMGVPWRMLRGAYLQQGFMARFLNSHNRVLGELGEEGCITYAVNFGGRPSLLTRLWIRSIVKKAYETELINGIRDLLKYDYIKIVEYKGETYIVPLDKFYERGGIVRSVA